MGKNFKNPGIWDPRKIPSQSQLCSTTGNLKHPTWLWLGFVPKLIRIIPVQIPKPRFVKMMIRLWLLRKFSESKASTDMAPLLRFTYYRSYLASEGVCVQFSNYPFSRQNCRTEVKVMYCKIVSLEYKLHCTIHGLKHAICTYNIIVYRV